MKVIRHAGVDSRMIILDDQARQQMTRHFLIVTSMQRFAHHGLRQAYNQDYKYYYSLDVCISVLDLPILSPSTYTAMSRMHSYDMLIIYYT